MGLREKFEKILSGKIWGGVSKTWVDELLAAVCAEEGHKDAYGHDGEKISETCERCGRDKWRG